MFRLLVTQPRGKPVPRAWPRAWPRANHNKSAGVIASHGIQAAAGGGSAFRTFRVSERLQTSALPPASFPPREIKHERLRRRRGHDTACSHFHDMIYTGPPEEPIQDQRTAYTRLTSAPAVRP